MAVYCSKNKWNSQQIQRLYKNKHRDEFDDANWSTNLKYPVSFGNGCNGYYDPIDTNTVYTDEYDRYTPTYWTCSQCTFNNTERDLYCSICKSPFKSTTNTTKYASDFMTFGDHLPPALNDMIHIDDDMDQSIQIAIIHSYHSTPQSQNSRNQTYTKPRCDTNRKTKKPRKKNPKLEQMERERRLKRERDRAKREKENAARNNITKCRKQCPKISTVIGDAMVAFIGSNIKRYYGDRKQYHIKLILKYDILLRFLSSPHANDNQWECEWEFVYHGTDSGNDGGIIDKGLVVGGTNGVGVRNGRCHGRGVYCSPQTSTAKGYERGSMFVCIVRKKRVRMHGNIWVVPSEKDILPLYLVSFSDATRDSRGKPQFPYFPISAALQSIIAPAPMNPMPSLPLDHDGISQQLVKFVPSFKALNRRNHLHRKIKRKWSAYHKINRFAPR